MGLDSDKTNTLRTHSVTDVAFLATKVNSAQNKQRTFHLPIPSRTKNVSIVTLIKLYILAGLVYKH